MLGFRIDKLRFQVMKVSVFMLGSEGPYLSIRDQNTCHLLEESFLFYLAHKRLHCDLDIADVLRLEQLFSHELEQS